MALLYPVTDELQRGASTHIVIGIVPLAEAPGAETTFAEATIERTQYSIVDRAINNFLCAPSHSFV